MTKLELVVWDVLYSNFWMVRVESKDKIIRIWFKASNQKCTLFICIQVPQRVSIFVCGVFVSPQKRWSPQKMHFLESSFLMFNLVDSTELISQINWVSSICWFNWTIQLSRSNRFNQINWLVDKRSNKNISLTQLTFLLLTEIQINCCSTCGTELR